MFNKLKMLILFIISGVAVYYTFYMYNPLSLNVDNSSLYLLNELSENVVLDMYSENTGKIDLAGLSNIVINMQNDGFEIQDLKTTDEYIDVILQNAEEVYRLYFTKEMDIISVSSPYSKNGVPFTYIHEREDNRQFQKGDE